MISTAEFLTFVTLSVAIAASPGPATAYVIASDLAGGPKSALQAVAGLVSALVILGIAGTWAIRAVAAEMAHALDVIRVVAPWVLVAMAVRMAMPALAKGQAAAVRRPGRLATTFLGGLLINFINPGPYAMFFFIVPRFQKAQPSTFDAGPFALPLLYTAIAGLTYLGVFLMFEHVIGARVVRANLRRYQSLASAAVLSAIAIEMFANTPTVP